MSRDTLKPNDLRSRILSILAAPKYQPLDKVELSKKLGLSPDDRAELRTVLRELERDGTVARIRKDRYVLPGDANLCTGVLHMRQGGGAWLECEGGKELFIAAENTGVAMNGDRVVARMMHEGVQQKLARGQREGQVAARVIRILEKKHTTVVGTLQRSKQFLFIIPDDSRLVRNVYVRAGSGAESARLPRPPQIGDKVVARLDEWTSPHVNPEGEIIEVLGPASEPGVDMLSIIRKHHLPTEFPPAVLRETEKIRDTVDERDTEGREDLRGETIITIDPDDARDFDDAINVERLADGGWRLGVHIADVSHYVRPGSALDKEALERGNSVYLADRVIPMLPERLSNGVCSLKPLVNRLTRSAFIEFSASGKIRRARFARTVIRSAARLTYKQAFAILTGKESAPVPMSVPDRTEHVPAHIAARLREAWELASLLRKNRFAAGSLDLDFPEVKVWLDERGQPVRLEKVENDVSHQLIEEFMLAANEVVAREIKNRMLPGVYRIHEDPDADRLADYRQFAISYGYKAGDLTNRAEVQRFLASIRGKPEEYALKLGFLKSLKRAAYGTQPLGHYGLAKVNYTHFTSPIRRYADLVVHRVLGQLAGAGGEASRGLAAKDLASVTEHISDTERTAAEAEKESTKLKKLEFFLHQLRSKKPDEFAAVVVDVRSYGLVVELPDVLLTGLIHVSALQDDFYVFDPVRLRFTGRRTGKTYALGNRFPVIVARVDVYKQQVDFVPVATDAPASAGRTGRAARAERPRPAAADRGKRESRRRSRR